jgi:hypothetical protein
VATAELADTQTPQVFRVHLADYLSAVAVEAFLRHQAIREDRHHKGQDAEQTRLDRVTLKQIVAAVAAQSTTVAQVFFLVMAVLVLPLFVIGHKG